MSLVGYSNKKEWHEAVLKTYPNASEADFREDSNGSIYFRLIGSEDSARYLAAWFPAYTYGFIEVQ